MPKVCDSSVCSYYLICIRGLSPKFVDIACKIVIRQNKMLLFKYYGLLITHLHTRTVHFSHLNDVYMIYQRRIYASLKPQFWNYPYHWHDILMYQASTIKNQHSTLSTVFQDNKPSGQERFLNISYPWLPNVNFLMSVREIPPLLKLALYVYPSLNYFGSL